MTTLAWKINRARLMGMPEICWRFGQALQRRAMRFGFGLATHPPAPSHDRGATFICDPGAIDIDALRASANAVLNGRWTVFALEGLPMGFPPQWNRCPKTATRAPMHQGTSIDYRNEDLVGDIKYLWEPARHLELVTLSLAWRATGERRYAEGASQLLHSWLVQCPYPNGVHWASSLELAVRLMNWSFAWQLLGDAVSEHLRRQWLDSVYRHCHFIASHFSRHSSANNHLFGEFAGLFVASLTWPCWPESEQWRAIARRGLEEQAPVQVHEDGVHKEQAIYYQHEVMDMMLLCQRAAAANGFTFSAAWQDRLERMAEYLHAVMDRCGHVPMSGDADDATLVRLAYGDGWCRYRSLLASCALLFGRADLKAKAGVYDDKNRWLFGAEGQRQWDALSVQPAPPRLAFPEGGHYLLGCRFDEAGEVRLVADCAPLGYLAIAAHGHADALSFTLSFDGEECLVDPGTYAYHTQREWRDYFRGTAAHNTLCIDGEDQSEIGGSFMWLRKANARLAEHSATVFEGEHDGYQRLADPVTHRRRIEFDPAAMRLVVRDFVQCAGRHDAVLHWHFAEGFACAAEEGGFRASSARTTLRFEVEAHGFRTELLRASKSPIAGWISRRFDDRKPIATAAVRGIVEGDTEIRTIITIQRRAS